MQINPWFITGLFEGEGAFTYTNAHPILSLRQRWDYEDLVRSVAEYFKVGKIYSCRARFPSQANTYYRINRLRELDVVIKHFDHYPMKSSKKRAAYEAWKRIVFFKRNGIQFVKRHPNEQAILLAALTKLNCRPRGKPSLTIEVHE
jgi:hypothetical protein